jgi:hypothetical protein
MLPFFMPKLTGYNMPKIYRQSREPAPSTTNEKTVADFTRVVEQTGILEPDPPAESRSRCLPTPAADIPNAKIADLAAETPRMLNRGKRKHRRDDVPGHGCTSNRV